MSHDSLALAHRRMSPKPEHERLIEEADREIERQRRLIGDTRKTIEHIRRTQKYIEAVNRAKGPAT
jgi:hypothetical protein